MPRPRNESSSLLADLHHRLDALVALAVRQGRESALAEIRRLVAAGGARRRGPGRPRKTGVAAAAKPATRAKGKRKNPWASLTPAARLARVNAIRKGRGLPVKDSLLRASPFRPGGHVPLTSRMGRRTPACSASRRATSSR